jgi:hypothetical protein
MAGQALEIAERVGQREIVPAPTPMRLVDEGGDVTAIALAPGQPGHRPRVHDQAWSRLVFHKVQDRATIASRCRHAARLSTRSTSPESRSPTAM